MLVTIPFAGLVPDNRRATVIDGEVWLSERYAEAKESVHMLAALQLRGRAPFAGDVALDGRLWLPDRRRRDVANLLKLVHDALAGVCYADDQQLADFRYRRLGLDRANPRLELTLTPALGGAPR